MTREEAIEYGTGWLKDEYLDAKDRAFIKTALEVLKQEPCEDEYIKVPKKALKYRTAGMVAYNAEWLKNHFDIERAVICGAQEPREDSVSRQGVEEIINDIRDCISVEGYCAIVERMKKLPPVNPQRTGHWIATEETEGLGNCKCSVCDHYYYTSGKMLWNYCPNCGAKMIEPQAEGEEA